MSRNKEDESNIGLDEQTTEAIRLLFETHAGHMYKTARAALGDAGAAEDVVSEVFLYIIQNPEKFIDKDCNTLAPLLDIIVRRRSINRYRYDLVRKKHSAGSLDDPDNWSAQAASSALAEDPAERMVNNAVLVKAVQALPDTERMAFYGKYVIGYTDAELAHMLGQKQGSIRCCLSRARRKIKAYLKEEGYFE